MSLSPLISSYSPSYSTDLLNLNPFEDDHFGAVDALNVLSCSSSINDFWGASENDNKIDSVAGCEGLDKVVPDVQQQQMGVGAMGREEQSGVSCNNKVTNSLPSPFVPQNNSASKSRSLVQRRNAEPPSPLLCGVNAARPLTPRGTSSNQKPASAAASMVPPSAGWERQLLGAQEFASVYIKFRSRREDFRPVEESLFSTIKYELHHVGIPATCPVRIRYELVFAQDGSLVPCKNGSPNVQVHEQLPVESSNGVLTIKSKIQFKTISYRHNQAEFCLRATCADERTGEPLLVFKSRAFKVYARRPDVAVPASRRLKKHRSLTTEELMAQKEKEKARKVGSKSKRGAKKAAQVIKGGEAAQEPPQKRIRFTSFPGELDGLFASIGRFENSEDKEKALRMLKMRMWASE